jgi:outer membrane receptor protein involved in Fe transport
MAWKPQRTLAWLAIAVCAAGVTRANDSSGPVHATITDASIVEETDAEEDEEDNEYLLRSISFWLQPPLVPSVRAMPDAPLRGNANFALQQFGVSAIDFSQLDRDRIQAANAISASLLFGRTARVRLAGDTANLYDKAPEAIGMASQKRSPQYHDARIRSSRVGRLPASGSYWIPARIDLDSALTKVDSRLIDNILTIKGPYAARYGSGFSFIDFQLLRSPRTEGDWERSGATSLDYQTNGEQWYGRQTIAVANEAQGLRASYGHRTGNDYESGGGVPMPASYNSRDFDLAWGIDPTLDTQLEVHYLRQEQTGVELPGQAFDIDNLGANGVEVQYEVRDQPRFDRLEVEGWYNRTRLNGNAQGAGKRRQFPFLDFIQFVGTTDVDSLSTGFRSLMQWTSDIDQLTAGVDLRYIEQQLDEISSGRLGPNLWNNVNSPIPRSGATNPGLFVEYEHEACDRWALSAGARVDWMSTRLLAAPATLTSVTTSRLPYESIVGTSQLDRDYALWSAYTTAGYQATECSRLQIGVGYAQRAPTLTELYVAESFMFLVQSGLNTITGDPRLKPERLIQTDLGWRFENDCLRCGVTGYCGWVHDAITFENTGVEPALLVPEQVQLRFVNTDLATRLGGELFAEYDWDDHLTCFGTLTYTQATDRSRNGDFATRPASGLGPSARVTGLPRGDFSGVAGAAEEPLPGIIPLESRLGVRLHPTAENPPWGIELSARLVASQTRVAASLLETASPGFTVWDARGFWKPTDHWLCVAGVENFTDRQYREHLDFRSLTSAIQMFQPGVSFYFGSELSY